MKIGDNGGPPLTDADVPDLTYVKFYPADFLTGTMHLSLEQRGAYITALCIMYDRMSGFPFDEKEGAMLLRVDKRVYRRVRDDLLADGKFYRDGDMIRNRRVEDEIKTYISEYLRRSVAAREREAKRRLHRTSDEVSRNLGPTSTELRPEIPNKSAELETKNLTKTTDQAPRENHIPEARSQKPEARTTEDKKGSRNGHAFWSQALAVPGAYNPNEGVSIDQVTGELRLFNGVRQQWLLEFGGDEELLRLALKQAANYVQPNAYKPLKIQVEAQLAQIVRQERSMQKRYEAAKKSKPSEPTENPTERRRRLLAQINAEEGNR